jgi:OmpA-OmpF porin, OOP family
MRLKPVGKLVLFIIVLGVAFGGYRLYSSGGLGGLIPGAPTRASVNVKPIVLPTLERTGPVSTGNLDKYLTGLGTRPGAEGQPEVRGLIWAWNAQMGLILANGGPQATEGSLMAANGVNLKLVRQDDTTKMQEALVAFATALHDGQENPSAGAHFVNIMGDGAGAFLTSLNDALGKLGPEYKAKIVCALGYSRGEDKFMGPPSWKSNPEASKGGLVAGVLRDGDWNIAQKWVGDNGLRTNPDDKTWDPDALNWVAANDYIDACHKYIAGYSETRPVVRNGVRTGETKKVTVNGVVTWTPGDVIVAKNKGGLVSIVSTREYASQMPCVMIGIDKWLKNNRETVEGLISAALDGGNFVKSGDRALRRAAEIADGIYKEEDTGPDYWVRYFKGVTEADKQGLMVELGGSSVNNLADALLTFGLVPGSSNLFEATYSKFGELVSSQYPDLVPRVPSASEITDMSYLNAVAERANVNKSAIKPEKPAPVARTSPGGSAPKIIGRRTYNIVFDSGKATFTPAASRPLNELRRDLLIASAASVEIHGHTDNQGNPQANMDLSEARAFAVKNWLKGKAKLNFPDERIQVFAHGQTQPVVPNSSAENRARNRRVQIILKVQ